MLKQSSISKEEIYSLHSLVCLRKPELTNNLEALVSYFKEEFNKDVTKEDLMFLLEPTLEEDIEDLKLIHNNVS